MKLVQISSETVVNPEHISHIKMRIEPGTGEGKDYRHPYPIYRITMVDGEWYDIEYKSAYPEPDYPFAPAKYLLAKLCIDGYY